MSDILKFKGLAIKGGGVAGLAYLGPLKQHPNLMNYTHFAGSSAGAMVAGFLAVRATPAQMEQALKVDFKKFKDNSWFVLKDVWDFFKKFGWYNGDFLLNYYREQMQLITGNADITLLDVFLKYNTVLIITKTDIMYPISCLVTMDYLSHPSTTVAEAVRASTSLPEFYEAVPGVGTEQGHIFIDGGVLMNYPIRLLYKYLQPQTINKNIIFYIFNTLYFTDLLFYYIEFHSKH